MNEVLLDKLHLETVELQGKMELVRQAGRYLHKTRGRHSWGFRTYLDVLRDERNRLEKQIQANSIILGLHGFRGYDYLLDAR